MFFHASKLLWFFAAPTNALVLLGLLSALLMFTRFARSARWAGLLAAFGLLVCGMSPLPYWLLRPLEDRFPKVVLKGPVDGVIVLGGAIGTTRGMTSVTDAGARMTESAALALRFPGARLVFTGGDGSVLNNTPDGEAKTEAEAAQQFYRSLGIPAEQILIEDKSRNTRENAVFTKALLEQKPGQRWLLITSAWHMPRSMGIFRRAGLDVLPYPVDFATRGLPEDYWRPNRSLSHGLTLTDLAVKEWIGLVAYRLAGYTDSLLPGP
jgi:uncharacterized SAM-binding protein YcdF (DUF218 family)